MEFSLVAAKLLGVYLVLSGWFLISRGKTIPHLLKHIFGKPKIIFSAGILLILVSLIILIGGNNVWHGTWKLFVMFFALLTLLKGLAYVFIPNKLHKLFNREKIGILNLHGIFIIIVGLLLFYVK